MNFVPGLTDPSGASGDVDLKARELVEWDAALLKLASTGGSLTADGSEQTLYQDNEPLGVWKPTALFVDLDNMQAGDTIEIKVYYRMSDAGSLQLQDYQAYSDQDGSLANSRKLIVVELHPNRHGFQVTLDQTAGTNRDYPWEFFAEV